MLKMFFKQVFRLIHYLRTHDDEKLPALERGLFPSPIVVFNDLDDCPLLDGVISEFDQNWR